jgi:hypothetical protein
VTELPGQRPAAAGGVQGERGQMVLLCCVSSLPVVSGFSSKELAMQHSDTVSHYYNHCSVKLERTTK